MKQDTAPNLHGDTQHGISILAVAAMKESSEIERILSHTRWQSHVVHSTHDAKQVLRSLPISVVLCEHRLPDGTWLDLMRETEQYGRRPQVIVLSEFADTALWAEVLNRGGYGLLATPLEPREVYALVPIAWRRSNNIAARVTMPVAELRSKRYIAKAS
jgi:DNA-binding response OmpR family regulator